LGRAEMPNLIGNTLTRSS